MSDIKPSDSSKSPAASDSKAFVSKGPDSKAARDDAANTTSTGGPPLDAGKASTETGGAQASASAGAEAGSGTLADAASAVQSSVAAANPGGLSAPLPAAAAAGAEAGSGAGSVASAGSGREVPASSAGSASHSPSGAASASVPAAASAAIPAMSNKTLPYLIIGAGPAGLVAGRALALQNINFEIVERHSEVGGIWDIANPGSPMYESAHFISSKTLSGFPGFPMPDDYPDYPNHRQILAYIQAYAKHCDLYPRIRFQTAVERIEPAADRTWVARFAGDEEGAGSAGGASVDASSGAIAGDGDGTRRYAGVIIGTGHQWEPRYPNYPGTFSGESYHSRDYHSADQFRGKRVLIVGAGNSGADIACDAARSASFAALSVRRGYYFIPKHIMGKPADVFAHGGPQLPTRIAQPVLAGLLRIIVGDPSQFGLPKPDHKLFESHPIVNTQVLHYLAHGDLVARPDIERLEGDRVRFIGGREEPYDTIVYATGYAVTMPFLDRDTFPWVGTRPDLFLSAFDRRRDNVLVLGLLESDGGGYPMMYRQAELIAQVIHDQRANPRQAEAFRKLKQTHPDLTGGVKYLKTERNDIYVQYMAYHKYADKLLKQMQAGKL